MSARDNQESYTYFPQYFRALIYRGIQTIPFNKAIYEPLNYSNIKWKQTNR
ncbi:MAG: hypothetical protein QNJ31_06410 [Candidatus Caenarcaniphilales bacterium]|nr:hypothetical protein [Candidatus Caenarcaniphilales bacterium]